MEFWAIAAVSVGAPVVGGAMQSRSSRKAQKEQNQATIEQMREQGVQDRETLRYQGELTDYWRKRVTQDRRNARGAQFDKYSRLAVPAGFQRAPLVTGDAPAANPGTTPANTVPTAPGIITPRTGG